MRVAQAAAPTGHVPMRVVRRRPHPAAAGAAQLTPPTTTDGPTPQQMLASARLGSANVPRNGAVAGNHVTMYVDYAKAIPAVLQAIEGAQQVIDVAMFSWEPTGSGMNIANALKRKALAGVEVNVMIDDVGSMQFPGTAHTAMFKDLERAGVHVIHNRSATHPRSEPVDHRKLVVVDNTTMFTGGMNISGRYDTWHDVMIRAEGPLALQGATEFLSRWVDRNGKISPRSAALFSPNGTLADHAPGTTTARLIANKPGVDIAATERVLDQIDHAHGRVWIESPWISDAKVAASLIAAAKRGVDVRVAVTGPHGWTYAPVLNTMSRLFFTDLVRAGVQVIEQTQMTHAKLFVIDDVATIGSMNLTRRAQYHDHELNAEFSDPVMTAQLAALMLRDFSKGDPVTMGEANGALTRSLSTLRHLTGFQY